MQAKEKVQPNQVIVIGGGPAGLMAVAMYTLKCHTWLASGGRIPKEI
ncbi:MAG TPA: hypothetical protein G4N92_07315 [Anaerolineae bacterium]|nr:hypothetical protein [Anaerolineae bacterium]